MELLELQTAVVNLNAGNTIRENTDRAAVNVLPEVFLEVVMALRKNPQFNFDMLCDHTAIDWPLLNSIELVYQLYSTEHKHYLFLSLRVPREEPVAPSVCDLWKIAEWQEREVYDLFGVRYTNHPDLRRLFLEDDWVGFPLRKDYKDEFMLERPW